MENDEYWRQIQEKRIEVFEKAYVELYGALIAYVSTGQKKQVVGLKIEERLFSGFYAKVQKAMQTDPGDLLSEQYEELMGWIMERGEALQEVLDPGYEFQDVFNPKESLDPGYKLLDIILSISGFLQFPFLQKHFAGMGPGLDLAREKVLYTCGKMVAKLEQAGQAKSDEQSRKSKIPAKKKVGYQAVWDAFHRVDLEGLKSVVKIGEKIERYLLEIEQKKPKSRQKTVYCGDYIGKSILPKDPDIKKILLREGILKK